MRVACVVALLALFLLSGFTMAASGRDDRFGDCPSGHTCEYTPDGDREPPNAVTGHTVYAKMVIRAQPEGAGADSSSPLPHHFPSAPSVPRVEPPSESPLGPQQTAGAEGRSLWQAECVAWLGQGNLDVRPDVAPELRGAPKANAFFSDEDEPDGAAQDRDPARELDSCLPAIPPQEGDAAPLPGVARPTDFAAVAGYYRYDDAAGASTYGRYAVVVERKDCDPSTATDFRYRGHLDFVDPNDIYHEVQEYDYVCGGTMDRTGPAGNRVPTLGGATGRAASDAVKLLFPWTGTDLLNEAGCQLYDTPASTADPATGAPGHFDLGHKCNGSLQDLFTERLWITPIHAETFDRTIWQSYTFALVVDTCSGRQVDEGRDGTERDLDALDYRLDSLDRGQPLAEVCHDGSSFSFDDVARGRTFHSGPPADEEEIMRGTAYTYDSSSPIFGKHRTNCRTHHADWSWNDSPGRNVAPSGPLGLLGPPGPPSWIGEDCFPEDHKTAAIDIYIVDEDPTGAFEGRSNGLTGVDVYSDDAPSGPDDLPE